MSKSYDPGFRSLDREAQDRDLQIEGTVPNWLSGTLVRNGPGRFEAGGHRVNHWFDGLAMLRRYDFDDGAVTYTNRFLRTDAYADAEAGQLTGQFGTDTRSGWRRVLDTISSLGLPEPTDNANVHVAHIDGEYVALTEAPRRVAFDLETLATRGSFTFDDNLPEHLTAAHLVDDPHAGDTIGFTTQFGRQPQYHIYRIPEGSRSRERIASIPARGPCYIHDCSVTRDHVVLVEPPLVLSAWQALLPWTDGAADMLQWQPEQGTRVLVVDRETGAVVADPTFEATFSFHHVNAFLNNGSVVLDLIEFPNADIVDAMSMNGLDGDGFPAVPDGHLVRYRVDPAANDLTRETVAEIGMELPRVARERVGRQHRYIYAQATGRPDQNGLIKIDTETGDTQQWWEESVYIEEPIPVTRPNADAPDDGIVMATALDTKRQHTSLMIFDATTLDVQARAHLPHSEPFGFHGRYFARSVTHE